MLKVNGEKILADYESLVEKKEKGLSAVEADAKAYALAHGYDEEKTAKFVTFLQGLQGSGLSDAELAKLDLLGSYIEEVVEPADKIGDVAKVESVDKSANPIAPNPAAVNIL